MNQDLFRLVFDRRRGACVVVAEITASSGKGRGGRAGSGSTSAANARFVATLAPLALAAFAAHGQALPTGASVVAGAAKVSTSGSAMTINQSTSKLVTDWQSFSIGAGNSVKFVQPSADSVALNRVVGSDPSRIFGSLSSNGQVFLQNGAGVLFGAGAQVDVGSLVATTLNVDRAAFMAGKIRMTADEKTSGFVRNEGTINAATGGFVVLAGPDVSNAGSISALQGTIAMAAANAVNVDPTGSGLLTISTPVAALNASLANSGSLTADGGMVALQAAAADAAARTVMQIGGVVRARSIEQRDGAIVLSGGASGVVSVSASMDASGAGASDKGGSITVLGDKVALVGSAKLDASGDAGGGSIAVGGNYQGKGPLQNATLTGVGRDVVLDASAGHTGDGGQVVVWSDDTTRFLGSIASTGGSASGNGGRVEVSGKGTLAFDGNVDTKAPKGTQGSLLLDPVFLTIGSTADYDGSGSGNDDLPGPSNSGNTASSSFITSARVASLLATSNVDLSASSRIALVSALTTGSSTATNTLSLTAPLVTIGAPMTMGSSSLNITTGTASSTSVIVQAPISSAATILLGADSLQLNAVVTAPTLFLSVGDSNFPSSPIVEGTGGGVNAGNLIINAFNQDVQMTGNLNRIGTLDITAASGTINVTNLPGERLSLQGTMGNSSTTTASGQLDLTVNAGVTQATTSSLKVGQLNLTTTDAGPSSGAVTLTSANNVINGFDFDVASSVALRSNVDLTISGTAALGITLASTGQLKVGGSITSSSTATPSNIDLTGSNGVLVSAGASPALTINVQPGGRFFLRSGNSFNDDLGALIYSANGRNDINYTVYGGYTGADPTSGNGLYTSFTGTLGLSAGSRPAISRVYDATTAFAAVQTAPAGATATLSTSFGGTSDVTGVTVARTGNFADKNAGTSKAYTVDDSFDTVATAQTGDKYYGLLAAGYTQAANATGGTVATVTPAPLTSTGFTGIDRVYDGTTRVALAGTPVLGGVLSGDVVNLVSGATGSVADKNVGTKPVTVNGLSLTGSDASNYTVSSIGSTQVTIAPRDAVASNVSAVDRTYDATTTVALVTTNAALGNIVSGDVVGIAGGATGSTADKNVGVDKPVTLTGATLAGADAGNYVLRTQPSTAVTVDITPKSVVPVGVTPVSRAPDGTTVVALDTSAAALSGVLTGDNVAIVTSAAVGSIPSTSGTNLPVTFTGLGLTGTDALNYTLAFGGGTAGSGSSTVTPTGVTVTILPSATPELTPAEQLFNEVRFKDYLQAVSDAQEPFRRALAEALAAGFGKENIRKQLSQGLVFETGLAPPAVDDIQPATPPATCSVSRGPNGASLSCP
ncbi:MAG: filamentous hemagglutinin [Rhizobacter sp.]|nr:filamentous hemagglutinin [Rhizobacter sp.]